MGNRGERCGHEVHCKGMMRYSTKMMSLLGGCGDDRRFRRRVVGEYLYWMGCEKERTLPRTLTFPPSSPPAANWAQGGLHMECSNV